MSYFVCEPSNLRFYQQYALPKLENHAYSQSKNIKDVSLLIYSFPTDEQQEEAFSYVKYSILQSWFILGQLKTIIVCNKTYNNILEFKSKFDEFVEIQVEPSLIPGNITTMSKDCICNLHRRFTTPYVLIIQDDGFPINNRLKEFLDSKYDFVGAPSVSSGFKSILASLLGINALNGGFSLRSKHLCQSVAHQWNCFWKYFIKENSRFFAEDNFYTIICRLNPLFRLKYKFPSKKTAFSFAFDILGYNVSIKNFASTCFGIHGKHTGNFYFANSCLLLKHKLYPDCSINEFKASDIKDCTILAYFFREKEKANTTFFRTKNAILETWRNCGLMKTVIVTNYEHETIQYFASQFSPYVEIQVEPTLIPGEIKTMSIDCNSILHTRFSTPYVLIVQEDGFPLRPGLEKFIGEWDYVGAPYVRNTFTRRLFCRIFNSYTSNGGFSLRSKKICELAARYWQKKYRLTLVGRRMSEDIFYTETLPLREPLYRKSVKIAPMYISKEFSYDPLFLKSSEDTPLGFHRMIVK